MKLQKKTVDLFEKIFKVLEPPPDMTLSEWADTYRRLSKEGAAVYGQWRTSNAPFQREIMDAISDDRVIKIVVMSCSQIGKTEALILNIIGYYIHFDPAPMIVIEPTIAMAEALSKDRISPMIRDTPVLAKRVNDGSRYSGNTIMQKRFAGGHVTMIGANSPNSLRMRPVRVVLADEIDSFPATAGDEGDPLVLADRRADTFWNKKLIRVSTPTNERVSRIKVEFDNSSQEEWNVPCPECGAFQPLTWAQIVFKPNDLDHVTHTCAECGATSSESAWKKSQKNGKFVAKHPECAVRGFHLNALASPWKPWREIVEEFIVANEEKKKGNIELLKAWVNTVLGEPWEDSGEEIDADQLIKRRERYNCEVPERVLVLTAGVDVQDNRLEIEVVGWGAGKESWGIQYARFYGSPGHDDVWNQLDAFLQRKFMRQDGVTLSISCTCVDTGGHFTTEAYRFCKGKELRRVFAIKGRGGAAGIPYVNKPTTSNRMKVALFTLGVDTGKETLLERLKVQFEKDGDKYAGGYCHFPIESDRGYDELYFEGITSEKRVTRYSHGRPRFEWVLKKSGARNEPLDLRVYATAALEIYNPVLEDLPPATPKKRKRGVVNRGI